MGFFFRRNRPQVAQRKFDALIEKSAEKKSQKSKNRFFFSQKFEFSKIDTQISQKSGKVDSCQFLSKTELIRRNRDPDTEVVQPLGHLTRDSLEFTMNLEDFENFDVRVSIPPCELRFR